MIKIVQLQYSQYSAGRAALRLHDAFLEENYDSSMVSLIRNVNDTEEMKHLGMRSNIISWVDNKLQTYLKRRNHKEFGLYSFPILGTDISKMDQITNADVIYLNWVLFGFLNLSNIEQLAKLGKPLVFIMHDMWSITGGCHHSFSCDKYQTRCNHCQMFPDKTVFDWPAREFDKKLKFYSKYGNLNFISPSKWLFDCAKKSYLTKDKPLYYIPNIINKKIFKPIDKKVARQVLDLDPDETILLFGAAAIDSPYKGWIYLQKALEILHQNQSIKKVSVLVFGGGYNKKVADSIPFKSRFMGFLRDEYSTALVYSSADVFITPSLADNQPTTVMESMCCGTPVVGFEVGGIPDMISHKVNGYLAKYKDEEDIAAGIRFCLEYNIKGKMLPFFEKNNLMGRHKELINNLIKVEKLNDR